MDVVEKRSCPSAGFDCALNRLSTADFLRELLQKSKNSLKIGGELPQGCYEVEKIVSDNFIKVC